MGNDIFTTTRDGGAALNVARRLRALAQELDGKRKTDPQTATLMNAFLGAARALETTRDPPPRDQLLALVQVLTAGLERLLTKRPSRAPKAGANDSA
jgi:hypothetical protein